MGNTAKMGAARWARQEQDASREPAATLRPEPVPDVGPDPDPGPEEITGPDPAPGGDGAPSFAHVAEGWTVSMLRAELARVPGHLVVIVEVAEEPGGEFVHEQVVIDVAVGEALEGAVPDQRAGRHVEESDPTRGRIALRLATEYPTGEYPLPAHPRGT